mgnify:CR=1 FL=1
MPEYIDARLEYPDFGALVGLQIHLPEPGVAKLDLELAQYHCNRLGTVHGGVIMTLLGVFIGGVLSMRFGVMRILLLGAVLSAASNLLRLLNLADPVQVMLMAGDLDMGHARALLSLDKATQITAANQISAKSLSVRDAESLAKKLGAEFNLVTQKPKKEKSRDIRRIEEELSDLLTASVEIRVKKRVKRAGKVEETGEISIQFSSLEELNGLIDKLRG